MPRLSQAKTGAFSKVSPPKEMPDDNEEFSQEQELRQELMSSLHPQGRVARHYGSDEMFDDMG